MPFPKTFDAYVPSDTQKFFTLAKLKPEYVPLETLRAVPLDPEHTASFDYAKKITPPAGFAHCIRCYYFSLAILHNGFPSGTPGVPQIPFAELAQRLYHACILHDLGWSTTAEAIAHPARATSFEIHGGIMAYEHLRVAAPALASDAASLGDVVQSIMLHTSQWPSGTSSATKMLLSLSAMFDLCGYDGPQPGSRAFELLVNRKTLQEIEKEFPRGGLYTEGLDYAKKEFAEKPDCLMSHFPGGLEGFTKLWRVPEE
ncbi:hypothetical protein GGX14DRAFT_510454 [Mycena pura]|uniref:HD domain-containing protein n=1 Tax=Mycena pura TaxID=153505 RepID=A0AAD7E3M1_9AGAR|nr:hypothetical protein GGX14DRAFT_510454 [Mycena pura]